MPLELVWEARDATELTDRRIAVELVSGFKQLGLLVTMTSEASSREATVIVSPQDAVKLAQWISDNIKAVDPQRKD